MARIRPGFLPVSKNLMFKLFPLDMEHYVKGCFFLQLISTDCLLSQEPVFHYAPKTLHKKLALAARFLSFLSSQWPSSYIPFSASLLFPSISSSQSHASLPSIKVKFCNWPIPHFIDHNISSLKPYPCNVASSGLWQPICVTNHSPKTTWPSPMITPNWYYIVHNKVNGINAYICFYRAHDYRNSQQRTTGLPINLGFRSSVHLAVKHFNASSG